MPDDVLAKLIGGPFDGGTHRVEFGPTGLPPRAIKLPGKTGGIENYRLRVGRVSLMNATDLAVTYDHTSSEAAK